MITNELQLRVTKAALRNFEAALQAQYEDETLGALTREVNTDAIQGELEILRRQVALYEQIKEGEITTLTLSFHDLAEALALARVAAGLTQKELAEQVGFKEQQIQRYEANDYAQASFARMQEIVAALDCDISLDVTLPTNSGRAQTVTRNSPGLTLVAPNSYNAAANTFRMEGTAANRHTTFEDGTLSQAPAAKLTGMNPPAMGLPGLLAAK